jgi:hypothetical protein
MAVTSSAEIRKQAAKTRWDQAKKRKAARAGCGHLDIVQTNPAALPVFAPAPAHLRVRKRRNLTG